MKSYGTYVLLALLLGGFGVHKFYVNKPGIGLLYIVFSWTFMPAVISLFEAIVTLMAGRVHFDNKYNKGLFMHS